MIEIKGMTWDHPRGINPLIATSKQFSQRWPDVRVTWEARSLEDFEDFPVEQLAQQYDLIMIDHPFVGTGVQKKVLEPLNALISETFLQDQQKNSVGGSYESYTWEGRQWALPADAAAQVSAYRPDLLEKAGAVIPTSWDEVFAMAEQSAAGQVAIPLNHTHSYCSFMTIAANIGGESFWEEGGGYQTEPAVAALELLKRLVTVVHPLSLSANPIHLLNEMASGDEIIYIPLIFGYSNYARENYLKYRLKFANIPSFAEVPRGSILGGVGIALSAYSTQKQWAATFMEYVTGADCQAGLYVEHDGQPGHKQAWLAERSNQLTDSFYQDTFATLQHAHTRPRYPGYSAFQMKAGEIIHRYLQEGSTASAATIVSRLNAEHRKTFVHSV